MGKLEIIAMCIAGFVIPVVAMLAINHDRIVLEDKSKGELLYFSLRS